jgi:outer membrane biosynthesis protein TonB
MLSAAALALGLALAGCETFDPTDITNIFDTKKRLPGERKPLFPDGTPGVPQGVPPELMKGNQQQAAEPPPPAAPQAAAAEPEQPKAKPKPKPKPKVVAKPAESAPAVTVRQSPASNSQAGATQWPDPPQQQQPQQQGGWSGSQGVQWPDPPQAR